MTGIQSAAIVPSGLGLGENGHVFLSHSSRLRQKPATNEEFDELDEHDTWQQHRHRKAFLTSLIPKLETKLFDRGFDAWVDKTFLSGGSSTDTVIAEAIAKSTVVVLLIDRDALRADYVTREATIAMFRQTIEDDVRVIPVLLGGVSDDDLKASPLAKRSGVDILLPFRPSSKKWNAKTADVVAEQIAQEVADTTFSRTAGGDSLTRRWVEDVTYLLSEVPELFLGRAADELGIERLVWLKHPNKPRMLASQLFATTDLDALHKAFREVFAYLRPDLSNLALDRTLPLWVPYRAATTMASVNSMPADARVVGVSTSAYRLGRHIVKRATLCSPEYKCFQLPDVVGEAPAEEALRRYEETIREELGLSQGDGPDTVIEYFGNRYRGAYAIVRTDAFDVATADYITDTLHGLFPGLTIVMLNRRRMLGATISGLIHSLVELSDFEDLEARRFVSQTMALCSHSQRVDADD
ncbi:toll/interleukin-1 receptor domain-containing protein [Mycobacterium sp. PSTR-4-N]|uniref:toll/interleukin-1 receptor domain-containing protein n=1 Tax=Mycobacterium sp. PSTR-4-N TaxID=2917745 RepID=UPI001F15456A|nr:toll/interleukin-1 receptor domain-containing protein [Mycobacterium sp. PSTR-4-N]MCG7597150.1 toll/interleukin-1 receptor domain-containing protein [Mycobacterium sp. PSTR-4-N]